MENAYEKAVKVDVYVSTLYCKKCDVQMEYGGIRTASLPLQHSYECPKCGKVETIIGDPYPITMFKEVQNTN